MNDKKPLIEQSISSTGFGDTLPNPLSSPVSHNYRTQLPSISSFIQNIETKKSHDISQRIFSPPREASLSSFAPFRSMPSKAYPNMTANSICRGQPPLSPPISPESKNMIPDPAKTVVRDPILYPADRIVSNTPLFADNNTHQAVEYHVATRADSVFRILSPPQVSDYTLALEFKSHMGKAFNANRRQWAQRELAQLKEDNLLRSGARGQRYSAIAPASGVRPIFKKPQPSRPVAGNNSNSHGTVRISKVARVRKNNGRGETPESGKKVAREDKDFDSLPDYCPPLSSLPSKPNSLKVDWKGAPIDLKFDPYAHLLHPDEVQLAANLRLDCATYLTSKRRIFMSRIAASKIGKEFRKTDAQQACKIDVNKASKLWQAFDKVGWLNSKWIPDYV